MSKETIYRKVSLKNGYPDKTKTYNAIHHFDKLIQYGVLYYDGMNWILAIGYNRSTLSEANPIESIYYFEEAELNLLDEIKVNDKYYTDIENSILRILNDYGINPMLQPDCLERIICEFNIWLRSEIEKQLK